MSAYASVAGWCEWRPGFDAYAIWFPHSIAYYPKECIELGVALTRAALAARSTDA